MPVANVAPEIVQIAGEIAAAAVGPAVVVAAGEVAAADVVRAADAVATAGADTRKSATDFQEFTPII